MDDHKVHRRLRRERMLEAMQDGYDYRTRIVPSGTQYRRSMKHRPQTPLDWEELED